MNEKIAVLGAGAWGTALAVNFTQNGHKVTLWGRDAAALNHIEKTRENANYLPGVTLPDTLSFEADIHKAVRNASIVLMVVPAQKMAQTAARIASKLTSDAVIISCAKGIEQDSGAIMSQVLARECMQNPIAVLSGPSFAADVVRGLPTAVTVAAPRMERALQLCQLLSNRQLRCYASDDPVGVDYGGALKNVLAIAAGIVAGKQLGASALAAITARGFAELQRVALALGAKPETLTGLSGLGDLILTCGSEKSRNFAYGATIGRGEPLENMRRAEGVATAKIAAEIAAKHDIDAPLITTISSVLDDSLSVDEAIARIMTRPVRTENMTSGNT